MSDVVISAEKLSKFYRLGVKEEAPDTLVGNLFSLLRAPAKNLKRLRSLTHFNPGENSEDILWALQDVSFEIKRGEVMGIIGRNGAGKSTLLKILSRITDPTSGRVILNGRVGSLLEVGTGFHPELSGRDNIYMNGTILGMTKTDIKRKFDEIVDFSGVERFLDTPVKRYSSGMKVRLAFAVAAHLDPEILIVDEVLAVGDADFQQRCLGKMQEVSTSGKTVLFVSHNMSAVLNLTSRCILLDNGMISTSGSPNEVIEAYTKSGHEISKIPFKDRSDRSGSQRVRFVDFQLLNIKRECVDNIVIGDGAVLRFFYEGEKEEILHNMHVSASLSAESGQDVLYLSTEVACGDFSNVKSSGFVDCEIPSLLLQPGFYLMNIFLKVNGVISDWIREAIALEIRVGDPFGTGKLPPKERGYYVTMQSWSVNGIKGGRS